MMNPLLTALLLLLVLTLAQTLAGMAMLRSGALQRRAASRFSKISTLLVVALGFSLCCSDWLGLNLHPVDLGMALLVLALLSHATIWAGVAFQINQSGLSQELEDLHFS